MTQESAPQTPADKLAKLVRETRLKQHRSARSVAIAAGIDIATMARLEQGKYAAPTVATLQGLAKSLEIPLWDLLEAVNYVTPYHLKEKVMALDREARFVDPEIARLSKYLDALIDEGEFDPSPATD